MEQFFQYFSSRELVAIATFGTIVGSLWRFAPHALRFLFKIAGAVGLLTAGTKAIIHSYSRRSALRTAALGRRMQYSRNGVASSLVFFLDQIVLDISLMIGGIVLPMTTIATIEVSGRTPFFDEFGFLIGSLSFAAGVAGSLSALTKLRNNLAWLEGPECARTRTLKEILALRERN